MTDNPDLSGYMVVGVYVFTALMLAIYRPWRKRKMSKSLVCEHPESLIVKSVESSHTFCELCECRSELNDATTMEAHYKSQIKFMTLAALRLCDYVEAETLTQSSEYRAKYPNANEDWAKEGRIVALELRIQTRPTAAQLASDTKPQRIKSQVRCPHCKEFTPMPADNVLDVRVVCEKCDVAFRVKTSQ